MAIAVGTLDPVDERPRNDRPRWSVLALMALLAVAAGLGVGLAVSGLPDDDPDTSIDPAAPVTSDDFSATTTPAAPSTAVPSTEDGGGPDTSAPATSAAATTTSETSALDTTLTATTTPETSPPDTAETLTTEGGGDLPARNEIRVVVANGNGVTGAAGFTADLLRLAGYAQVNRANGTELFERTVVYHDDGFEEAAIRLVDDLDLGDVFVVPVAGAPPTNPPAAPPAGDAQILVYLGAT